MLGVKQMIVQLLGRKDFVVSRFLPSQYTIHTRILTQETITYVNIT